MNVQPGQNKDGKYQAVFQIKIVVGSEPAPDVAEGKRYKDDEDVVFDIHKQHKSDQQHDHVQEIMFFIQQFTNRINHETYAEKQYGFFEHARTPENNRRNKKYRKEQQPFFVLEIRGEKPVQCHQPCER